MLFWEKLSKIILFFAVIIDFLPENFKLYPLFAYFDRNLFHELLMCKLVDFSWKIAFDQDFVLNLLNRRLFWA